MNRVGLAALTLAFASVALTGCATTPAADAEPETFDISGVIRVAGEFDRSGGCTGAAGFTDFREGAQITVQSPDGNLIGLGELAGGKRANSSEDCNFRFDIADIPTGEGLYSLDVGNAFRGIYTLREEDAGDYISLTVG